MENRDRDEMNPDSNVEQEKSDSESSFGENTGRSEEWKDKEESIESGSDLGSSRGYGESGGVNRDKSSIEH